MPHSCSAWKCTNRFTVQTRSHGITFHRFPKDKELRKQWETAARGEGFFASPSSMLCSEHFRPEDFDRTGQTVRIRAGAVPSVFCFPAHLHRRVVTMTSQTSKNAQETLPLDCSQLSQEAKTLPLPSVDHSYALPSSHDDLRARLMEALARVESLERERRNAKDRERRAKITSHNYTKYQREFAITVHLHGPKVYIYLRETLNISPPHPHTLQRWKSSVDAKPGLNMLRLDRLKGGQAEDPAKYGCVCLMLDALAIKKHAQDNPHTQCLDLWIWGVV